MDLFYKTESPPTMQGRSSNGTELDVASRLDALATFLVSLAYNVKETQQGVAKLLQSTK